MHESVFLGLVDDAPRFGFRLDPQAIEPLKARNDLKITDLRTIAVQGLVDREHLPPLAEAKALLGWHARHRFCPNCGATTDLVQAGWRRDCPSCDAEHFPRTDPVVIMLAISGERCVLGRSRRFAPTMWSCLAGFAEPGELIEEAVRREVLEEVGIACGRVKYFASQPWPFPSSIMIGCHAQALSETIVIDREELEDARWFERDELAVDAQAPASGGPDHAAAGRDRASHHPQLCRGWLRCPPLKPGHAAIGAPRILCTGIIVLDEVFRVDEFPQADGKVQANGFFVVNGGCAANAAVAIARLGGRAALAGPMGGPAGEDDNGDRVLKALAREQVDCSFCQRIDGLATALSAIFMNARGDRTIVTYRDERIAATQPADPTAAVATADAVLADNRYPDFVQPICAAARAPRHCPSCSTATGRRSRTIRCFGLASHVIFSSECLRDTTGIADLGAGLQRIARRTDAFLAVSNGPDDIVYLEDGALRRLPVFQIDAVDTLGAGDAFHGGFALALAEGRSEVEAMRFGAAVAGIKCIAARRLGRRPDSGRSRGVLGPKPRFRSDFAAPLARLI